jgi:hypothetical protein
VRLSGTSCLETADGILVRHFMVSDRAEQQAAVESIRAHTSSFLKRTYGNFLAGNVLSRRNGHARKPFLREGRPWFRSCFCRRKRAKGIASDPSYRACGRCAKSVTVPEISRLCQVSRAAAGTLHFIRWQKAFPFEKRAVPILHRTLLAQTKEV